MDGYFVSFLISHLANFLLSLGLLLKTARIRIPFYIPAFTCAAAVFDFLKTLPAAVQTALHLEGIVAFAGKLLPLFGMNLGWVVPAILGFALGMALRALRKK